ncbi:flagellar biosynthesis protein FlgH [Sphingomonas sp. HMWF008]|nr:flagellar biosynthesis protein FlgH [Sphingomonas sp. HMWF008]
MTLRDRPLGLAIVLVSATATAAQADDLYKRGNWSAISSDRKAGEVGDMLTVVVYQTAESTNSSKSDSAKNTALGGALSAGSISESGSLKFGGSYTGGGAVQKTERFVTQITVIVEAVLPNGDLQVAGQQRMHINGETSDIGVRGRVRVADITSDNRILSSRVANAQIDYAGRGFVSRSSKPGLINTLFRVLGLG